MANPRIHVVAILALLAAALVPSPCCAAAPPSRGLCVRNGQLLKDGRPFRAIGINVTDLADDILDRGEAATKSFAAIRYLGQKKVPFIRFWASYFYNHSRYLKNPARYWHNMDLLVSACERAGLGIAPSLFWNDWALPAELGEFRYAWADEDSKTRRYMRRYVHEFVSRYGKRKCVWLYEFSNENNLAWDLPNAMEFLPEGQKDARNFARSYIGTMGIRAFARAVRRDDQLHPITSGTSVPRPSQYHLATEDPVSGKPWTQDTPEQQYIAATWGAPNPVDLLCVHYYPQYQDYDGARVRGELETYMSWAERMRKPLYVGEFAVYANPNQPLGEQRYKACARDLFQAVYESNVPLAAWWAYAGNPIHFGPGAVNPNYGRYEYVLGLIREYNDKIARDLARR